MQDDGTILVGKAPLKDGTLKSEGLTLQLANRHGLVAGATGTGKTVTLQVMAEGFSNAGVPVFAADIKGDLSGLAAAGESKPVFVKRAAELGISYSPTGSRPCSGTCSETRAIRSAAPSSRWGRCCSHACWSSTTPRKAS
jgi:hypothetical protein